VSTKLATWAARSTASVRRLLRQENASTAVEFGLVVAPFLALIFAILETTIVFFAGQALETAVAASSRLIKPGQAQTQNFHQTAFKNAVCAKIYGLFNCQSGVFVDVKSYSKFSNISISNPVEANVNFKSDDFGYKPGGPGDIVVVRLYYQWPVYISLLGFNLANVNGGKRLLAATSAFRNESYSP
jgi:Flp pilus assembly protein TadG